ncbi:hypothetical protein HJC23_010553 [Cyclotella cryptica]|uniref:CHORD domain-containing protein n=1 Tax=Cyclotella cryptica TaxID=29204 RepID=A0ABD3QAQ3_9STRA|eukprot:CCRYP_007145-RA/>CCRYP_007145-RA protein AED:0.00 eAED:0.00 QI:69/-1/1/1/-1/1/1/120/313
MKVFLRYEENDDESTHKTLKITLPKSWKTGPTSRLLDQFIESYNAGKEGEANPLEATAMHLSVRRRISTIGSNSNDDTILKDLPSDGIVIELISDRDDVYVCHSPSRTSSEINSEREAQLKKEKEEKKNQSQCVHFGCNKRFPKGGPYPDCHYHSGPPVFHETAKFWSCCPDKKAYDWESFQSLPTCQSGTCTDVREESDAPRKEFLGGCDLREQISVGPKLRSIDDFNASVAAGGSERAPVAVRLRSVLEELGVENELFDQVFDGIKKQVKEKNGDTADGDDARVVDEAVKILGTKLKSAMKSIAVEQLRIR